MASMICDLCLLVIALPHSCRYDGADLLTVPAPDSEGVLLDEEALSCGSSDMDVASSCVSTCNSGLKLLVSM
jgi:hypothetical protein